MMDCAIAPYQLLAMYDNAFDEDGNMIVPYTVYCFPAINA